MPGRVFRRFFIKSKEVCLYGKKPKTVPKMNFQFDLDAEMVSLKSKLSALIMFFKGMNEFFTTTSGRPRVKNFTALPSF
jgi:hypothetical protein